jgi:hypothetical protein
VNGTRIQGTRRKNSAELQDFRSENLVLEATGVSLQRRVTQRVRTRTNKRKTVGTVNKECEWVCNLLTGKEYGGGILVVE